MRGKPFVDKRFSPAPPSKKLFSGGAAGPRRWTVGSGQRPVDRENRKRKALCLPLPVFGAYGVPCVRSAPLNGCPRYKTKTRRAECLPRFCFGRRPLCQRVVLVLAILPGDRQWGLSGVVPGSPSSCIKRVGRRMGAWGKEGPLRASQRSLLPPSKNPVPLSPTSLRRYSESRVMATGMVMTERTVDRLTSRAPKGASVL